MSEASIFRPIALLSAAAFASVATMLVYGVLGDRFGKYRLITFATFASALTVAAEGLAGSPDLLGAARLASGATAGGIVPLSMAFVGDHLPYGRPQTVLVRFLTGTILGMIAGQVLRGVLGECRSPRLTR